jgi:hypothetical protein
MAKSVARSSHPVLRAQRLCDCVVAVITQFNPNVMYELGFAHAQGKPAVLLCQIGTQDLLPDLPFDLRNEQVIAYRPDNLRRLRDDLSAVLSQLVNRS